MWHWKMGMREKIFSPAILVVFILILLPELGETGVMITRPGISDEACAKKCKEEVEIDCRFYKWHKTKLSCFLSALNDSSITHMKKIEKPEKINASNSATSWVGQLQSRMLLIEKKLFDAKELKKEMNNLRMELSGLKNSRALTHHLIRTNKEQQDKNMDAINQKVDVLKTENKRMEDAIMTLGELQKSFSKKLSKINEDKKSSSLSLAMLGQSNKDIKANVAELSSLSSKVQESLSNVQKEVTEMEVRFASLSTDVMEKAANLESMVGPEIKEMGNTQTNLAQALSLITKKIMLITPKIPQIQHLISQNDGLVSTITKKVKEFHNNFQQLNGRIRFAESQMRAFLDPSSKINTDRRHTVSRLQEEVAVMRSSQKRIQNDVLMEISDRTKLYKKLSEMKLQKSKIASNLAGLEQKYKNMNKNIRNIILNGPQGDLISKILHRQVEALRNMKAMRDEQGDMRLDLGKFSDKMKQLNDMAYKQRQSNMMKWASAEKLNAMQDKIARLENKLKAMSLTNKQLVEVEKQMGRLTGDLVSEKRAKNPKDAKALAKKLANLSNKSTRDDKLYDDLRSESELTDIVRGSMNDQGPSFRDVHRVMEGHRKKMGDTIINYNRNKRKQEKALRELSRLHNRVDKMNSALSSVVNEEIQKEMREDATDGQAGQHII